MNDTVLLIIVLASLVSNVVFAAWITIYVLRPWLWSIRQGARVSAHSIIGMKLRGRPTMLLTEAYCVLRNQGIPVTLPDVQDVYLDNKDRALTSDDVVELTKNAVQRAAQSQEPDLAG